MYVKRGATCRPCIVKVYVAVFFSLTVKAVHLEAVSDLTGEAFLGMFAKSISWHVCARQCGLGQRYVHFFRKYYFPIIVYY